MTTASIPPASIPPASAPPATGSPLDTWSLDREVVLTRVVDAPIERVYAAFTSPSIGEWFGPHGHSCTTHEFDARVGGRWRFDMSGPAGERWPSRIEFLELVPNARIVFDHGDDVDDDPGRFRCTITFDAQSDGKTVLSLRQLHPTTEQRSAVIGFGAVELGGQTLDKLATHLGAG